jgi:hypothetical protein
VRTYTVQRPPYPGSAVLLPEGFSWGALVFGPIWFLWHGLWMSALLLLLVQMALSGAMDFFGVPLAVAWMPSACVSVLVGFNARDWWRLMLDRQDFTFVGVVMSTSLEKAEWTLMERVYAENAAA